MATLRFCFPTRPARMLFSNVPRCPYADIQSQLQNSDSISTTSSTYQYVLIALLLAKKPLIVHLCLHLAVSAAALSICHNPTLIMRTKLGTNAQTAPSLRIFRTRSKSLAITFSVKNVLSSWLISSV